MSARLWLVAVIMLGSTAKAEAHIGRARQTFTYGDVNPANEYGAIAGVPVQYDAAGNLCHDEDGRGYEYDEQNRLTRVFVDANSNCVFDGGETQLAAYTYDALGRKVTATVGSVTTRFYYDGQRVIEERNAGDAVVRYHVNGGQFIDEHIATYDVAAAAWTYYLPNANYSIAGTGDATGTTIERLDYSAGGDFAFGPAGSYAHDADGDADIDLHDFANLQVCFGTTFPACLDIHDFDLDGQSNGVINIDDFDGFAQCFNGPDFAPLPGCEVAPAKARSTTPETGMFTLHGRPIDVLPDGKVLMDFRTRIYDPQHGRWLQRDGAGYADGANLYEAFSTNAMSFTDPMGLWIARRIGEILADKGRLTVGDIAALGRELHSNVSNQLKDLTPEEIALLAALGGAQYGTPFSAETLPADLRADADERWYGIASAQQRYRAEANYRTRRRLLWLLLIHDASFSQYVTDLYRVVRDLNPAHFIAEREYQIMTGEEMVTWQPTGRVRAGAELVVGLALMKALPAAPRAVTEALGGEVPGITAAVGAGVSAGRVRVYRVEGTPNSRIAIDDQGAVLIAEDTKMLFLNFGNRARAEAYFAQKLEQGLPGAQIKSFEVSRQFLDELRATAVTQRTAAQFPDRPQIVDVTKAPDQFGLRPEQVTALREAIIPGTGRVEP